MRRNNLSRFIIVILVVVWSVVEFWPPYGQDLTARFSNRARNRDATFTSIVTQATQLQKERPLRAYDNLADAIGTNDITRYFPFFAAKEQVDPKGYILGRLQREAAGKVRLGIDLQGGTSFLVEMGTNTLSAEVTNQTQKAQATAQALSQAIDVLRKRVDKFGVAEPVIQPQGDNFILIQMPGLSKDVQDKAEIAIKKPAYLEFRMVHDQSEELIAQGLTEPGYVILNEVEELPNGRKNITQFLVEKTPKMVGGIKSAGIYRDNFGKPEIDFVLDANGAERFAQITRDNVGRRLAIILDGELQTAPVIKGVIDGGRGQITGSYTEQKAFQLASVLENPLKAPLKINSSSRVDPTLGNDSIASGIKASLIGVLAVAAFMLVYYMFAGLVADIALMLNIIILLGVMCAVGTTLTLPGIAGVVLTIGMAVDANVLIFERIREELAAGKSMRGALSAGYDKAFGTIFDSNLTTLISSVILIFMGTGSVKGFGITLTIGVCVSLFTALVVTRLIFDWMLAKDLLKGMRMLHLIRGKKIDFMRWAIPAFMASWLLIIIGNSYGIFYRGHDVLGVEFAGGDKVTISFDQSHKVEVDRLRAAATKASSGDVLVAYQRDISTSKDTLLITVRNFNEAQTGAQSDSPGAKVVEELKKEFPEAGFTVLGADRVGPTVGKEIQTTAILAALLAMFGILVYVAFRYEFSFAVGAVIAIIHDVFMTLGWYFLAGRELNGTTVAAILTIIGFSINDTIVIFDRIREDLKLGVRGTFREVMNQALNQTLSRTIITSGTVFLATLSLYIFGGGVINDFAFTFLVGILTGTYSSIYIASAIVLWWHKGQRPDLGGGAQMPVQNVATTKT
jgi:SecD/SecF fusion protein